MTKIQIERDFEKAYGLREKGPEKELSRFWWHAAAEKYGKEIESLRKEVDFLHEEMRRRSRDCSF